MKAFRVLAAVLALAWYAGSAVAAEPAGGKEPARGKGQKAAGADELIQPYGGLSWEDGLEETVIKLNALQGVETIVLGNGIYEHSENVKGKYGRELKDLLIRNYGRFTGEGAFANADLDSAQTYVGPRGAKIPFHEGQPAEITARPVVLCGVPFEMKIEHAHSPGLAVRFPDRILVADDGTNVYAISTVLRRVTLSTHSPIPQDRLQALRSLLVKTFGRFKGGMSEEGEGLWGKVEDARGTMLAVDLGKSSGYLAWSSRWFDRQLGETYRRHQAGTEGGDR